MYFGTFDYIILAIILIFNFGVWKFEIIKKRNWILYLLMFLFFGFIIPFISIDFEIRKVTEGQVNVDSFTLLYTYFRVPIWWFIGISEAIFLKFQCKK